MKATFRLASIASVLLALTACGGGGGSAPPGTSIAFSAAPPSSMAPAATASLSAIVTTDASSNTGVTWSVACGSSDCGAFSTTSTDSGSATVYTAPAAIPNPASVTITATAVADGTQTSATVAIAVPNAPVLADGTYVYHVSGQDGAGSYTISGAFSVAAGKITGGEQDYTGPNAGYTDSIVPATSSLALAGGNIQVVLDTGNQAIGIDGLETLRGTVVSASRVLISEFDLSASGTGSIDRQTGAAAPSGGYAFAVSGNDTSGNPLAIGGVLNVSGTSLSTAGSVFDISAFNSVTGGSSVLQAQAFQSGSVSAPDAYGRVVFTLTPNVASGVPAFALAGYIVSPARIQLVESAQNGDVLNANTGGAALGQGASTGHFSATSSSVVGQSYAHGSAGMDANGNVVMAGGFALNADGSLGGTLAVNDLTAIGAWSLGGNYTVDPTGRITVQVTSLGSQTATPPVSAMTFQLYLDGNGNAMVLGDDGFQTSQGIAFTQDATVALGGDYALAAQGAFQTDGGAFTWSAIGPVGVTNGSFSGYTDYTVALATPQANQALSGSQDATRGLLQLVGLNGNDFTATTAYGYYPASGNRLWAIEVDSQGASLLLMEPVQH